MVGAALGCRAAEPRAPEVSPQVQSPSAKWHEGSTEELEALRRATGGLLQVLRRPGVNALVVSRWPRREPLLIGGELMQGLAIPDQVEIELTLG